MHLVRRAFSPDRPMDRTADMKYFVSVGVGDEIELLIELTADVRPPENEKRAQKK